MKLIVLTLFALITLGCSHHDPLEQTKHQWTQQGWVFHETFGEILPSAAEIAYSKSDTARVVRAFASDGVNRAEKELIQEEDIFLVVTMQDGKGRTYSVIFKKKKRTSQSGLS